MTELFVDNFAGGGGVNKPNIYRIRIVMTGRGGVEAAFVQNICGGDSDELRGEIENYCMALEDKYHCAVRCVEVEEVEENGNESRSD